MFANRGPRGEPIAIQQPIVRTIDHQTERVDYIFIVILININAKFHCWMTFSLSSTSPLLKFAKTQLWSFLVFHSRT